MVGAIVILMVIFAPALAVMQGVSDSGDGIIGFLVFIIIVLVCAIIFKNSGDKKD